MRDCLHWIDSLSISVRTILIKLIVVGRSSPLWAAPFPRQGILSCVSRDCAEHRQGARPDLYPVPVGRSGPVRDGPGGFGYSGINLERSQSPCVYSMQFRSYCLVISAYCWMCPALLDLRGILQMDKQMSGA